MIANINYKIERAEQTSFPDHYFDLITIAQAIHWFDFQSFYKEVRRTLKSKGIVAVMGYGLLRTEDSINHIIDQFYTQIIGAYWDKERIYIDEKYETIPFPFQEMPARAFNQTVEWNLHHFMGYINTWSAVQLYEKEERVNPLSFIEEELNRAWGKANSTKTITFPILLRIGRGKSVYE